MPDGLLEKETEQMKDKNGRKSMERNEGWMMPVNATAAPAAAATSDCLS